MNKAEKQAAAESLRSEATVLRQTRENYKEARANIEEKLKVLSERTQTQSVIWQRQYQEALKGQLDTAIDTLSTKNYSSIRQYLSGEYENGFLGTMYSLQKQGIPLVMPIDQRRVVKMIETTGDKMKLSKKLYGNATKLKNAVRREISIGLASGEGYEKIAGRLTRTMGVDYNKTVRIARTEGGRVQNSSRFDAMTGAKENGADIVKQWDSTLDNRTRTAHRELDGQIAELEDKFKYGKLEADHPHGFGVAWMDVNCRCVIVQRARWAIDDPDFQDYTKFSRFDDFDREAWIEGKLKEGIRKKGGNASIIDLSDSENFSDFKARYKIASNNLVAQTAAVEIGVEVMGEAIPETVEVPKLSADDFPSYFTEKAAAKKKTQAFVDYVNGLGVADSNVAQIYKGIGKLFQGSNVPFEVKYGKDGHAVSYWISRFDKKATKANIKIPLMKGENLAGEVHTTAHELGHLIDHLAVDRPFYEAKSLKLQKFVFGKDAIRVNEKSLSPKLKSMFGEAKAEKTKIRERLTAIAEQKEKALKSEFAEVLADPYHNISKYKDYQKKRKKIWSDCNDQYDLESRNHYNGLNHLEDIYDALSAGELRDFGTVTYGHGTRYYSSGDKRISEIWANYCDLSLTRPDLVEVLRKDKPELVKALDEMAKEILEGLK